MLNILTAGLIAANFATYPSMGDRGLIQPKSISSNPRVEHAIDKGLIIEMIVRCQSGVTVISYSKVERLYCSPKLVCSPNASDIVAKSCG